MIIKDVSMTRHEQAAFRNRIDEDEGRVWLPEDFEDEPADFRITLTGNERSALRAGVIAHDHINPDQAVLENLSAIVKFEFAWGAGRDGSFYIKANEFSEFQLLTAGAWAARNAATVIPVALTEEAAKHGIEVALGRVRSFEEAFRHLSLMTAELEVAGILSPAIE